MFICSTLITSRYCKTTISVAGKEMRFKKTRRLIIKSFKSSSQASTSILGGFDGGMTSLTILISVLFCPPTLQEFTYIRCISDDLFDTMEKTNFFIYGIYTKQIQQHKEIQVLLKVVKNASFTS